MSGPMRSLRWMSAASVLLALLALSPIPGAEAQGRSRPEGVSGSGRAAARTGVARLAAWVSGQGGELGAAVVDVHSGEVLAESAPGIPLNPASNMKVLTAATALVRLGADHRFTTGVYGSIDAAGTAERLVLRGHGDPSLRLADLWRLAHVLRARGLKKVTGGVLVDQSWFDESFVPPAFGQQPDEWASFRAPVCAVALERNAVTMNVLATRAGQPARVWFDPPGFVEVRGDVPTRPAGAGQGVRLTVRPQGNRLDAHIGGYVAQGLGRLRFRRRVDDPRALAGYAFVHLLRESGVDVEGDVQRGGTDATIRLAFVESEPLGALIHALGKYSDNFSAEMLLKTLGAELEGRPGRSADGAKVVEGWMKEVGALGPGTIIKNGSGLFDANRVSALGLARALRAGANEASVSSELVAHLAIGGVDGTLKSRFRRLQDSRAVRAKTGTLARADALSGYVMGNDGQPAVAFSFLVNGLTAHWQVRREIDRAVGEIVKGVRGGGRRGG